MRATALLAFVAAVLALAVPAASRADDQPGCGADECIGSTPVVPSLDPEWSANFVPLRSRASGRQQPHASRPTSSSTRRRTGCASRKRCGRTCLCARTTCLDPSDRDGQDQAARAAPAHLDPSPRPELPRGQRDQRHGYDIVVGVGREREGNLVPGGVEARRRMEDPARGTSTSRRATSGRSTS